LTCTVEPLFALWVLLLAGPLALSGRSFSEFFSFAGDLRILGVESVSLTVLSSSPPPPDYKIMI
jgi:hypothetical protein